MTIIAKQLNLFTSSETFDSPEEVTNWGTFKESLRAPVHRWFTYPAGFSYKAVEYSLGKYGLSKGDVIYDPFMGSGTTNIVAKTKGMNSYGVEAHPFVFKITKAKLNWDISIDTAEKFISSVNANFNKKLIDITTRRDFKLSNFFPELVMKCYPDNVLSELLTLRILCEKSNITDDIKDFFFVVITALLRNVSSAATGWPYIAPKKAKTSSLNKDVLTEFSKLARRMLRDVQDIKSHAVRDYQKTWHKIYNADSRSTVEIIPNESVDHVFTSPPYLNNFDYSDRTRLELYFWGEAKNWKDISDNVRTKLMTSATTQISRNDTRYEMSEGLKNDCPDIAKFLLPKIEELSVLRKIKGGKKSYDLMVSGCTSSA
jgi:DNA modification methylase